MHAPRNAGRFWTFAAMWLLCIAAAGVGSNRFAGAAVRAAPQRASWNAATMAELTHDYSARMDVYVRDADGAGLEGAEVRVYSAQTHLAGKRRQSTPEVELVTGGDGFATTRELSYGSKIVVVERSGYATARRTEIIYHQGYGSPDVEFVLQPAIPLFVLNLCGQPMDVPSALPGGGTLTLRPGFQGVLPDDATSFIETLPLCIADSESESGSHARATVRRLASFALLSPRTASPRELGELAPHYYLEDFSAMTESPLGVVAAVDGNEPTVQSAARTRSCVTHKGAMGDADISALTSLPYTLVAFQCVCGCSYVGRSDQYGELAARLPAGPAVALSLVAYRSSGLDVVGLHVPSGGSQEVYLSSTQGRHPSGCVAAAEHPGAPSSRKSRLLVQGPGQRFPMQVPRTGDEDTIVVPALAPGRYAILVVQEGADGLRWRAFVDVPPARQSFMGGELLALDFERL